MFILLGFIIILVQLCTNISASSFSQCSSYELFSQDVTTKNHGIVFGKAISLESLNSFKGPYDLELNFSMAMTSDAFLILHNNPDDTDLNANENMIAIGIGQSYNEKCIIIHLSTTIQYKCYRLLSVADIKSFWLRSINGTAYLGLEGQTKSFLSWNTPDISKAKYVRFGAYQLIQGAFFFNCSTEERPKFQSIGFTECLEYNTKPDITTDDVFPLSNLVNTNKSYMVDLHFSVLIGSHANIILTSDPKYTDVESGHVYLIEIGRQNFECRISTKTQFHKFDCYNLLSPTNVRSFWIRMTFDGHLYLGTGDKNNAFHSWYDSDPLPVGYFAFVQEYSVPGRYYYNCTDVY